MGNHNKEPARLNLSDKAFIFRVHPATWKEALPFLKCQGQKDYNIIGINSGMYVIKAGLETFQTFCQIQKDIKGTYFG